MGTLGEPFEGFQEGAGIVILLWPELATAELRHAYAQERQKNCDQHTPESDRHHSFLL